jgi:hypothetical protein
MGGTLSLRLTSGDVLGDRTVLPIANRTCFGERGVFGCFKLLRRLVMEISDFEDERRWLDNCGRSTLFESLGDWRGE